MKQVADIVCRLKDYSMLEVDVDAGLGAELSDFMQGTESAEQALADVEAAYAAAAIEAGFVTE